MSKLGRYALAQIAVFSATMIAVCGCGDASNSEKREANAVGDEGAIGEPLQLPVSRAIESLPHEIVEREARGKWFVLHVVTPLSTESEVSDLLNLLFNSTRDQQRVGIYVYPTRSHYESRVQWIAMAKRIPESRDPEITIDSQALGSLNRQTSEVKFGYTETERRKIFEEIVLAEDRAQRDAEIKYPMLNSREDLKQWNELGRRLEAEYVAGVAMKYGLNMDEMTQVKDEAYIENWPLPSEH